MMSLNKEKTKNTMYISEKDSTNKVGQTYNTQLTQVCKRCLGRNHVANECYSKKYCTHCRNASHNTFNCAYLNQNDNTQEKSYRQSNPQPTRGNHTQNRGRGSTPKRPLFNTSRRSPTGRYKAPQGRKPINNITMQENEVFSTANIQFRDPENRHNQISNDFETEYNEYENTFENDSSGSEYETQIPNNAENGRPILNNMFI